MLVLISLYGKRFPFSSSVVGNKLSSDTVHAHCAHTLQSRCARSKLQFLTAVQCLKSCRLMPIYVWMVYQLFNFGSLSWKRYPLSQSRITLSVTSAMASFRLIHIQTIVYLTYWPHSVHHPPRFPPNPALHIRRQCGGDPNDQQRTKRKPKARHKNAQSRFELVVWASEFGCHSSLIKYVRTNDHLADILTKGMFTTMPWHSLLILWQIKRPIEWPCDVFSFSRKL